MTPQAGLPKKERLSSKRSIDALFSGGRHGYADPLKYRWLVRMPEEGESPVGVMFSVSKKSFKRAWKRNLIKRRMKESYRQRKHVLAEKAAGSSRRVDIAFICTADRIPDFKTIDDAIAQILARVMARG